MASSVSCSRNMQETKSKAFCTYSIMGKVKTNVLRSLFFLVFLSCSVTAQEQQDPTTLNGGSCLGMAGKGCVALAVDKRFGSGPQMVTIAPRRVFFPSSQCMVAFTGLEGDIQALLAELKVQIKAKSSHRFLIPSSGSKGSSTVHPISAKATSFLISHVLYNRRQSPYYVEPLILGLMDNAPFLCAQDVIGAQSKSGAFICAGAASKSLYGTAEALFRPNLEPNDLCRVCGQAFLSALERDCLSGYGCLIYLMTKEGVEMIELDCRND